MSTFVAENWLGEPRESDEMNPSWFEIPRIPYDQMWQDARFWLPPVLNWEKIDMHIIFNDDLESVASVTHRSI